MAFHVEVRLETDVGEFGLPAYVFVANGFGHVTCASAESAVAGLRGFVFQTPFAGVDSIVGPGWIGALGRRWERCCECEVF